MAKSGSVSRLKAFTVTDPVAPANRSREALAARLRLSLQLSDDGIAMKLSSLKRRFPKASDQEIQAELNAWLRDTDPSGWVEGWTVRNSTRFAT